jgi:cytochrome c1
MKKYPSHSRSLFTHANDIIKYMPIDKEAGDLLSPLFKMDNIYPYSGQLTHQQQRVLTSGGVSNNNNNQNMNMNMNINNIQPKATKRSVSETKKKFVAAEQGWKCGACKQQLPAWFEVDHKIRLENGGSNQVDNLVALCRDCHGRKTAFENL